MTRERRAFLLGYKRGLNQARAEFLSGTAHWEDRLHQLEEGYAEFMNKIRRERAITEALTERATTTVSLH